LAGTGTSDTNKPQFEQVLNKFTPEYLEFDLVSASDLQCIPDLDHRNSATQELKKSN